MLTLGLALDTSLWLTLRAALKLELSLAPLPILDVEPWIYLGLVLCLTLGLARDLALHKTTKLVVLVQVLTGPTRSKSLRLSEFLENTHIKSGHFVSPTHRPLTTHQQTWHHISESRDFHQQPSDSVPMFRSNTS